MAKRNKPEKSVKPGKTKPEVIQFVEAYIANGRNAKRAYLTIRPEATEKTAEVLGSRTLGKVEVQAYLQKRETDLQERMKLTTENVLRELSRIVYFDIRKLYNDDGTLKAPHELDDDTAAALIGIETDELFEGRGDEREHIGYMKRVTVCSKVEAIKSAMKHLGLFEKDREQLGKAIGKAIIVPAKAHAKSA